VDNQREHPLPQEPLGRPRAGFQCRGIGAHERAALYAAQNNFAIVAWENGQPEPASYSNWTTGYIDCEYIFGGYNQTNTSVPAYVTAFIHGACIRYRYRQRCRGRYYLDCFGRVTQKDL
jgi:hypothetical protein